MGTLKDSPDVKTTRRRLCTALAFTVVDLRSQYSAQRHLYFSWEKFVAMSTAHAMEPNDQRLTTVSDG
jgi:hypothetical protein